ncbi:hypothetical protein C0992_011000 [Termitomyces sp. T32_za158]|nr:hypothetical protein C0992_011000 [Termitomyces sp. T32_za158]
MDKREEIRTPSPSVRKRRTAKHALPSVIKKILPPSPSAAELSLKFDFERLVNKLRETRVSDKDRPQPGLMLPEPIQPQEAVHRKAIDEMQDKGGTKDVDALAKRMPLQPSARMNAARPRPKEKPFRGGRLPVRPPLPRWDLHEA